MGTPEGGGGRTRVIENGKVLEKAVSISQPFTGSRSHAKDVWRRRSRFFACGLSLVYILKPNGADGSRELALF
jgi:coproporphyrinogen III oxidase